MITEKEISVIQIEKNNMEAKLEKIYDSVKKLDEENNTEVKYEPKINPKSWEALSYLTRNIIKMA